MGSTVVVFVVVVVVVCVCVRLFFFLSVLSDGKCLVALCNICMLGSVITSCVVCCYELVEMF